MELAGLAVATAAMEMPQQKQHNKVLILCGPGNNGGDGLVAARHLKHFGLQPHILYPKQNKGQLFVNLVQQCRDLSIPFLESAPHNYTEFHLIVDALFGFSFIGPLRDPFSDIILQLSSGIRPPVLSVDIPSGWDVERGDIFDTKFTPEAVISLTLPKLCVQSYAGIHFIGGRFVPPKVADMYSLRLPDYGFGSSQIVKATSDAREEL
jgi:NAD(P)H-hydrate epimerase